MSKALDLTNETYGKLKCLRRVENKNKMSQWLCECVCKNKIKVPTKYLRSGKVTDCGCSKNEKEIKLKRIKSKFHLMGL